MGRKAIVVTSTPTVRVDRFTERHPTSSTKGKMKIQLGPKNRKVKIKKKK